MVAIKRASGTLLSFVLTVSAVLGQQPNQAQGSMNVNGVTGPPFPMLASVSTPGSLGFVISGSAGVGTPFALLAGPLNVGNGTTPNGQIADIGTPPGYQDVVSIMNGLLPGPLNALAFLGQGGVANLALPVPPGLPGGTLTTVQTLVFDPANPDGFAFTAATTIAAIPPLNFGTVKYCRGSAASTTQGFVSSNPGPPVAWAGLPTSLDVEPMGLAGFQYLGSFTGSGSHPYWRRPVASVAPLQAMHVGRNGAFPYNRTLHGDLYCFQDLSVTPNQFGFFLATPGAVPSVLTSTVLTGTGATGANQVFETEVAVHGSLMLAVEDREANDPINPGQNDQIHVFSLTGQIFPLSGTSGANLTPVTPPLVGIAEESMTLTVGGWLFFVGSPTDPDADTGLLFEAPTDGSMAAVPTAIPVVTASGTVPTEVDGELRYSDDRTMVVFQAGTSSTEEDLYVIRNVTPAGFSVINLTQFAMATEIEEFGDGSDGLDNQVAISPMNAQVAFIVRENGDDELYIVPADGSAAPLHLSGTGVFEDPIDDIHELWWADDDNLLFFAGTSTQASDLYRYVVSSATLVNLTMTNGLTGPPIMATPSATIDPDGVWPSLNRQNLYFLRDGTNPGGANIFNVVAVDFTSYTPTNITGGEFSGTGTPDVDQSSATSLEIAYAETGTQMVFIAELATGTDDEAWSFEAETPTAAVQLTANNGATQVAIDVITPNPMGTQVAFASDALGGEDIYLATMGMAGSAARVVTNPSGAFVTDGGLVWNAVGLHYLVGTTSSTNPLDASLAFLDAGSLVSTAVDTVPGGYFILDATFP